MKAKALVVFMRGGRPLSGPLLTRLTVDSLVWVMGRVDWFVDRRHDVYEEELIPRSSGRRRGIARSTVSGRKLPIHAVL